MTPKPEDKITCSCGKIITYKTSRDKRHLNSDFHKGINRTVSPDIKEKYKRYNATKAQKQLAELGHEALKEKRRIAQANYRAKKKAEKSPVENVINEISERPDTRTILTDIANKLDKIAKEPSAERARMLVTDMENDVEKATYALKTKNNRKEVFEYIMKHKPLKVKEKDDKISPKEAEKKRRYTLQRYFRDIELFYEKMTGKTLDWTAKGLDLFKDHKKVVKYINDHRTTYNTSRGVLNAISSVLSWITGYKQLVDIYRQHWKIHKKKAEQEKAKNLVPVKDKNKVLNWEDILKLEPKIEKYALKNKDDYIYYALYACYTKIAPRRIGDFRLMKVVERKHIPELLRLHNKQNPIIIDDEEEDDDEDIDVTSYDDETLLKKKIDMTDKAFKLNKSYNYLILNEKGIPTMMIMNNYKIGALRKYGTYYNNNLPTDLKDILVKYIKIAGIKSGDFLLFPKEVRGKIKPKEPMTAKIFGDEVMNPFIAVADKRIGVNILRHAYISWFMPMGNTTKDREKKQEIAYSMSTSVKQMEDNYLYNELTPNYKASS